jgi:hypothetical protein
MYSVRESLRSKNRAWQFSEDEIIDLKLEWVKKTIKTPELHEERFVKSYNQNLQNQIST